jgi:hypothetical protein
MAPPAVTVVSPADQARMPAEPTVVPGETALSGEPRRPAPPDPHPKRPPGSSACTPGAATVSCAARPWSACRSGCAGGRRRGPGGRDPGWSRSGSWPATPSARPRSARSGCRGAVARPVQHHHAGVGGQPALDDLGVVDDHGVADHRHLRRRRVGHQQLLQAPSEAGADGLAGDLVVGRSLMAWWRGARTCSRSGSPLATSRGRRHLATSRTRRCRVRSDMAGRPSRWESRATVHAVGSASSRAIRSPSRGLPSRGRPGRGRSTSPAAPCWL